MKNSEHKANQDNKTKSQGEGGTAATARATFAGGCFWCMQPIFESLQGVISATVGFTGGHTANPTYEEVSSGHTGHAEAVEVIYDPKKITYQELVEVFWRNIDPTTYNRQFSDYGSQYRTAIFYHNLEQRKLAEQSKAQLERAGSLGDKPIATEILPATTFYPAEEYHQDFFRKESFRYNLYKQGSGRESRLRELWGIAHK
jgi:peptide-methionine (S)-S-oxide reductase